jgi:hypothetical protein
MFYGENIPTGYVLANGPLQEELFEERKPLSSERRRPVEKKRCVAMMTAGNRCC